MSNPLLQIENRKIGLDHTPLIIAEIGINHGGSLNVAKKMVDAAVKSGAMQQLLMWISFAEIISFKAISQMMWEGSPRAPGDYGFDPCGVCVNKSQEYKDTMALKELKNGRLAMLAFSGIVTQAVLTGKTFPF